LTWRSVLTSREVRAERTADGGTLGLAGLFADLPFELLTALGTR
jgi:hypothetical protein